MSDTDLVTPNAAATAQPQPPVAPAPAPADAQQPAAPTIPPTLSRVPAIQGLLAGSPAAFSVNIKEFKHNPLEKEITKHKDDLLASGFGFYRSISGDRAVLFNRFHVHPEDLKAADKAGKLEVLAPPFSQVDHMLSKSGTNHPLFSARVPAGLASPTPPQAPQAGAMAVQAGNPAPQANAAMGRKLLAARLTNLQPGAPTSGPAPGGGRLLNSVLKQVV